MMMKRDKNAHPYAAAVDVAWHQPSGAYKNEGAAVAAVQRRSRGLKRTEAATLLQRAQQILAAGKVLMTERRTVLWEMAARQKVVGPADMQLPEVEADLRQRFPQTPVDVIRQGIWLSAMYVMR